MYMADRKENSDKGKIEGVLGSQLSGLVAGLNSTGKLGEHSLQNYPVQGVRDLGYLYAYSGESQVEGSQGGVQVSWLLWPEAAGATEPLGSWKSARAPRKDTSDGQCHTLE